MFAIDWHYRANSIRGRRDIDIPEIRRGFDFKVGLRETGNGCLVPFAAGQCVKYPAGKQLFVTCNNVGIADIQKN